MRVRFRYPRDEISAFVDQGSSQQGKRLQYTAATLVILITCSLQRFSNVRRNGGLHILENLTLGTYKAGRRVDVPLPEDFLKGDEAETTSSCSLIVHEHFDMPSVNHIITCKSAQISTL